MESTKTVTDNAAVLTGLKWTSINRIYYIETRLKIPHHQYQKYSEGIGGNLKLAVIKLLYNTPYVTLSFWCFVAIFLDKVRRYLSKPIIDAMNEYQLIKNKTGDMRIFRFYWFELIWFY